MFVFFKDHGRYRRGQVVDMAMGVMRSWFPDWQSYSAQLSDRSGRINEAELRRYVKAIGPDLPAKPMPAHKEAAA